MKIIHILILEGSEKRAEDKEAKGMKVTKCNNYKCNKCNKKKQIFKTCCSVMCRPCKGLTGSRQII